MDSCSPFRVPIARLAASQVAIKDNSTPVKAKKADKYADGKKAGKKK
jgi:hypothetical protein